MTVYALNLFDVANRDEYLAYSKRSVAEVARYGGRVVALGKFREAILGETISRKRGSPATSDRESQRQ